MTAILSGIGEPESRTTANTRSDLGRHNFHALNVYGGADLQLGPKNWQTTGERLQDKHPQAN
jgi:hypothetical protein